MSAKAKNNRETKKVKLRKWRLTGFLLLLAVSVYGMAVAGLHLYDAYGACSEVYNEFDRRKLKHDKFNDEKYQHFTNILLIGLDGELLADEARPQAADTVILMVLNHKTSEIRLISVPPNTLVDVPGQKQAQKIKDTYCFGGTQLVVRSIENTLKLPVHHFMVLDGAMFIEMMNLLNGMDIYVENDMHYSDPAVGLEIDLHKGFQHLNGQQLEHYLRYVDSDLQQIGRVQRQQKFLRQFIREKINWRLTFKSYELYKLAEQRLLTSISAVDAVHLVQALSGTAENKIAAEMLPGGFWSDGRENYWKPDAMGIDELVNEIFQ